ncbi:DVU_1551 family NTP transferase [Maridesulfovibrio frigidus]|uniref:DVU_1551 family NTP transferase n=1 Tax=Maridesulfovibrio frigidus TaxID=340956 RepID=UPI00055392D4|nr:NTP transferase domain-containing protein [Maridesulfovibrio frigidus]
MKIYGIILAAGLSSRMGKLKALLPLDGMTVLATCINTLLDGGADEVFVVTGYRAEEIEDEANRLGVLAIHNSDYEQGMFSSVITGVKNLPSDTTTSSAFFILPVDIPLVRSSTVRALTFDYKNSPAKIYYPCFKGERGHPPLISTKLIPDILAHDGTGGLRTVLDRYNSEAKNKKMPDIGIIHDMDTPEDYEKALKFYRKKRFPVTEECEVLWEIANTPLKTQEHCKTVAMAACILAETLNKSRNAQPRLDIDVVQSAALMHDVAKITRNHEAAGGTLLSGYGFTSISDIVASHRDTNIPPNHPITEKEIVFLADKFIKGTTLIPLRERYEKTFCKWADDPDAVKAIKGRRIRAESLLSRYEDETQIDALTLLKNEMDNLATA